MKRSNTRDIVIQYPDGKMHTIRAFKFYSVLLHGKEEFVLEYDDLTDNMRNCFTILDIENNVFVKRPLESQQAYKYFYDSIKFMFKKPYELSELPNTINLCNKYLNALRKFQQQSNSKRKILIHRDIHPNHDVYPYYLDKKTSAEINIYCDSEYLHLSPKLFNNIIKKYDVELKEESLGLGKVNDPIQKTQTQKTNKHSENISYQQRLNNKQILVIEDVSPIREEHPFYIDRSVTPLFGNDGYYHLTAFELQDLKNNFEVIIKKRKLNILKQTIVENKPKVNATLTEEEIKILDALYDRLMDFEDYYTFFDIEELRNSTSQEILNSEKIVKLTILLKKGQNCNNDIAVNLLEFLEGFKEELKQKNKLK